MAVKAFGERHWFDTPGTAVYIRTYSSDKYQPFLIKTYGYNLNPHHHLSTLSLAVFCLACHPSMHERYLRLVGNFTSPLVNQMNLLGHTFQPSDIILGSEFAVARVRIGPRLPYHFETFRTISSVTATKNCYLVTVGRPPKAQRHFSVNKSIFQSVKNCFQLF